MLVPTLAMRSLKFYLPERDNPAQNRSPKTTVVSDLVVLEFREFMCWSFDACCLDKTYFNIDCKILSEKIAQNVLILFIFVLNFYSRQICKNSCTSVIA